MDAYIYIILNKTNNHFYMGSTTNFKVRMRNHLSDLRENKHCNAYLQAAWNKYGEQSFTWYITKVIKKIDRNIEEQSYLNKYECHYNLSRQVPDTLYSHTDDAKAKIAAKGKIKVFTEKARKRMSEGQLKRWSDLHHKKEMSEKHKGRLKSLEARNRLSKSLTKVFEERRQDTERTKALHDKLSAIRSTPEKKAEARERIRNRKITHPALLEAQSNLMKDRWAKKTPEEKAAIAKAFSERKKAYWEKWRKEHGK